MVALINAWKWRAILEGDSVGSSKDLPIIWSPNCRNTALFGPDGNGPSKWTRRDGMFPPVLTLFWFHQNTPMYSFIGPANPSLSKFHSSRWGESLNVWSVE